MTTTVLYYTSEFADTCTSHALSLGDTKIIQCYGSRCISTTCKAICNIITTWLVQNGESNLFFFESEDHSEWSKVCELDICGINLKNRHEEGCSDSSFDQHLHCNSGYMPSNCTGWPWIFREVSSSRTARYASTTWLILPRLVCDSST